MEESRVYAWKAKASRQYVQKDRGQVDSVLGKNKGNQRVFLERTNLHNQTLCVWKDQGQVGGVSGKNEDNQTI